MIAIIFGIFGALIAAFGALQLNVTLQGQFGIERLLFSALILLVGIALVIFSILVPRYAERTDTVENCLGYKLKVDTSGEILITCPRDEVEAKLHRGELSFDEYAELVAPFEYGTFKNTKRDELAKLHLNSTLLSSEYADELEALAAQISELRDSYAAGQIDDDKFAKMMDELR